MLIDAVSRLSEAWPDLAVHIVGDGEARVDLERQVAAAGQAGRIKFHGRLSVADRDRLVSSAWLTVNCSAGEGWGLSVIEAAARGVPAVAFRVPGMQDSVRPGATGWLVDNDQELSDVINEALTVVADPHEAAGWGSRCREWAAEFTWEATAERILSVLLAENGRLAGGYDDRRRRSDAMTVVDVPRSSVTAEIVGRLRRADQARSRGDTVQFLMGSADEQDARRALERLGIPTNVVCRFRAARHLDLLGWRSRNRFELSVAEDSDARVIVLPGAQKQDPMSAGDRELQTEKVVAWRNEASGS
jgi:hypothetical protein